MKCLQIRIHQAAYLHLIHCAHTLSQTSFTPHLRIADKGTQFNITPNLHFNHP